MSLTGALLGAAGVNVASGLISGGMNAAINYASSKKLMRKQYDLNMRQWNAQNEYNLPTNQMKRLADAGLNPHLVYGNGGTSTTASLPSSASQGHGIANFDIDPLADLSAYQGVLNQQAVEDNTRASSALTREQQHQLVLNGEKQRELMEAQANYYRSNSKLADENAFTQGLQNSVIRGFTGDNPSTLGTITKSGFDRASEAVGDFIYSLTNYKDKYKYKSVWSNGALRAAGRLGRR